MNIPSLNLWATALLGLSGVALLHGIMMPLISIDGQTPLIFMHDNAPWHITLQELPDSVFWPVLLILCLPHALWLSIIGLMGALGWMLRKGKPFLSIAPRLFSLMGGGLILMTVLETLGFKLIVQLLLFAGILDFMPDGAWYEILDPGLILAGLFFVILAKIMAAGHELQTQADLTI